MLGGGAVGLVLQELPEGGAVPTCEAKAPWAWKRQAEALGPHRPCGTSEVLLSTGQGQEVTRP